MVVVIVLIMEIECVARKGRVNKDPREAVGLRLVKAESIIDF